MEREREREIEAEGDRGRQRKTEENSVRQRETGRQSETERGRGTEENAKERERERSEQTRQKGGKKEAADCAASDTQTKSRHTFGAALPARGARTLNRSERDGIRTSRTILAFVSAAAFKGATICGCCFFGSSFAVKLLRLIAKPPKSARAAAPPARYHVCDPPPAAFDGRSDSCRLVSAFLEAVRLADARQKSRRETCRLGGNAALLMNGNMSHAHRSRKSEKDDERKEWGFAVPGTGFCVKRRKSPPPTRRSFLPFSQRRLMVHGVHRRATVTSCRSVTLLLWFWALADSALAQIRNSSIDCTVGSCGTQQLSADGSASTAFGSVMPNGIVLGSGGVFYLASPERRQALLLDSFTFVTASVLGSEQTAAPIDGTGSTARFQSPSGLVWSGGTTFATD
eukprot:2153512-Rhodomonas_salina.1